jgi:hypothetical protein
VLLFILAAGAIAVLTFAWRQVQIPQVPQAPQEPDIHTNVEGTCDNACHGCVSKEYDARCFDRCRFGFKPYCD